MSIPQTDQTIAFDTALTHVTARAKALYPAEACRIAKGSAIALSGGVRFLQDGTAYVTSQTQPDVQYHCNGVCECPDHVKAPAGRCKHRWSRSLTIWAAQYAEAKSHAVRYYAQYTAPDGERLDGTAAFDPADDGQARWLFVDDLGERPFFTCLGALVLGPEVALFEAQRASDGNMGAKFGRPQYAALFSDADAAIAASKAAIAARKLARTQEWNT